MSIALSPARPSEERESRCRRQPQQHDDRCGNDAPWFRVSVCDPKVSLGFAVSENVAGEQSNRKIDAQGHQDDIVEEAQHWNEIGNEVDRAEGVGNHNRSQGFGEDWRIGV